MDTLKCFYLFIYYLLYNETTFFRFLNVYLDDKILLKRYAAKDRHDSKLCEFDLSKKSVANLQKLYIRHYYETNWTDITRDEQLQSNFSGSNTFRTMKISSRQG